VTIFPSEKDTLAEADADLPWSGDWQDTIGLGRSEVMTARQRYGDDCDWVRRWTIYAQVLGKLAYSGRLVNGRTRAGSEILEEIGSPSTLIYDYLDVARFGSGENLGRKVVEDVFLPAIEDLYNSRSRDREISEPVAAWFYYIDRPSMHSAAYNFVRDNVLADGELDKTGARQKMIHRLWAQGLFEPKKFPGVYASGLRAITRDIDRKLAPLLRDHESAIAASGGNEVDYYLDLLLPPDFAQKVRDSTARLKAYRPVNGFDDLGIDENGHTELLAKSLPQLAKRIANRQSMLLLGPTSSGKSHVGRIAVSYAVRLRKGARAVVLLPTKALVTQAVQEWEEFKADTTYEGWRVLAGSRDYPENDDALIRGAYEIAILIPEKLSALMAAGMRLRGCTLLVVDELQHLSAQQRGPRLEMLLTTVRNEYPEIPLLGLSATLTDESAEIVRRWLQIEKSAVIRATKRPVPLDKHACDDRRVRGLSAEGEPIEEALELSSILERWHADSVMNAALRPVRYQERSLALAIRLLRMGERSVLCFVGSRNQAELMALAAQEALQREPSVKRLDFTNTNPFLGRYQPLDKPLSNEEARKRWSDFKRFPPTQLRATVTEAVRTGVGFHTARLEQSLRAVVETAFREGQIRLLFATDTLKLGLNLPADAVIVSSMTTPTGGGSQRVLDRDDVAQRLGRAGRLGYSTRGKGYLVVPSQPPKSSSTDFDDVELSGLAELATSTHPGEAPRDRAARALCDVDAVFLHYLAQRQRDYGTGIRTTLDNDWFAGLVLQMMVRDSPVFTREELERRVDGLYRVSMGAVADAGRPDPSAVLRSLLENRLIGESLRMPGNLTITGLGRALSASGIPFKDAETVQCIAKAALDGAGTMTLLWMAANTSHVRDSNDWISLNSGEDDDLSVERLEIRLLELARAFVGTPDRREKAAALLRFQGFRTHLPNEDLLGSGKDADELAVFVLGPSANPGIDKFTALLRTCVLTLWMHGCPLDILARTITENIRVHPEKASGIAIHDADVRALGENVSYVFSAVSELLGVRPTGTTFRRLQAIGEAVQFGVPQVLAPLLRLPLTATHRERIVQLVPHIAARDFDSLADLVDAAMSLPPNAPRNPLLREQMRDAAMTASERAEVRTRLEQFEGRRRARSGRLPADLRGLVLPGLQQSLSVITDDLCSPQLEDPPEKFARVFKACGLRVDMGAPDLILSSRVEPQAVARVRICVERVTAAQLDGMEPLPDIVIAVSGVATGATVTATSPAQLDKTVVVVEPATLLEALGRVITLEQHDSLTGDYRAAQVTADEDGDTESPDWDDVLDSDAYLGYGLEHAGAQILQILRAAPPVLTRSDLNRLVAGLTVAAPPPLSDLTTEAARPSGADAE
jgi:superfamily II DNA/RNA helicase